VFFASSIMRIMGIDPGTLVVGYGVIDEVQGQPKFIHCGAIKISSKEKLPQRLKKIYSELQIILQEYKPDAIAIEKIFSGKNIQTAIRTGEGRGIALLAAANAEIPIFEYDATIVKKAVVGAGLADKKQVQFMVQTILQLDTMPTPLDASDALAIALCHQHSLNYKNL